jgi:homopolymeric O-antigen transport system ATP-binding protein
MSDVVIDAQGLSKRYRLGELGGVDWLGFVRRRSASQEAQEVWAARDLTFQIRRGEAVGIVGSNGAGKSTLLKMLSRVTSPTAGRARVVGRVGTILEVGTGFHPELTGRENIYLSGSILGMRNKEVAARFDEIVAFAGVERFVDTPVKRYSSGMYVRLAFAVAAHLEPDIMIIDEVLAVGDIGFQKKCLSKMDEGVQGEGRTILFVSHNLQAIRSLCRRALLLEGGRLVADGGVSEVIGRYLSGQQAAVDVRGRAMGNRLNRTGGRARFTTISVRNTGQGEQWTFRPGQTITLDFAYEVVESLENLGFLLTFATAGTGEVVTSVKEVLLAQPGRPGQSGVFSVSFPNNRFRPGEFALTACLGNGDFSAFEDIIDSNVNLPHLSIESEEEDFHRRLGYFSTEYSFAHG